MGCMRFERHSGRTLGSCNGCLCFASTDNSPMSFNWQKQSGFLFMSSPSRPWTGWCQAENTKASLRSWPRNPIATPRTFSNGRRNEMSLRFSCFSMGWKTLTILARCCARLKELECMARSSPNVGLSASPPLSPRSLPVRSTTF